MSELKLLDWKKIGKTKRAQYRVSHLSEVKTIKQAYLSGDDATMVLHLEVIASEDCLIVTYYLYGNSPAEEDYFFEFIRSTSSIENGKQIAEEVYRLTKFDTSIRYLVSEYGFELQS